ncbi:hypothetical protein [Mycolicibacterium cosmeticum]|uniref:Acetaldehyde dehydrogenase n=1 Tax=Mycolicibacterium cosmeticum TaxID=258533 RepID=W9BHN5_MYCCO|nr:hypothetical protein [Mycolicibacterium cosmeticum]CDO06155.1 acetaldehyde dehydrogenase [Mycolicibacterium cosmeticum]
MTTGAARAAVPVVAAVGRSAQVRYAEVVTSLAARSTGPDTRRDIDDHIEQTCAALVSDGGADIAKAIVVINPADPPVPTRYTVYCLAAGDCDAVAVERDVTAAVDSVRGGLPGLRLAKPVQFEGLGPVHLPRVGPFYGTRVTALLEIGTP